MRKLRIISFILIFLTVLLPVFAECAYCGQKSYGGTCVYSPTKKHEHRDDPDRCRYCGSRGYGKTCAYSPEESRVHVHASGGKKCIYCGSKNFGRTCVYSPTGIHER